MRVPVVWLPLVLVLVLLGTAVSGQEERRVSIVPERPEAGSAFVVEVILPGERAEAVVPREPGLAGPVRYTGADVRPGQGDDGVVSAVIEYRFAALAAGRIDIVGLSALSGGRVLTFGSWIVDAVAGAVAPVRRYGSWIAPGSVVERELFTITALGPDGRPVSCPAFAVEGALFEPLTGEPGSFRAVALQTGTLRLPRLTLGTGEGAFELEPRAVAVRALPASAGGVQAVGGPWRLELSVPAAGYQARPDELVAFDLRATGRGWPGLAGPPSLAVEAPDGSFVPLGEGSMYAARAGTPSGCVSGIRGTFKVRGPGVYIVRPEPYAWFDPVSNSVQKARAPVFRLVVAAAPAPEWTVPGAVEEMARQSIAELAAGDAVWLPVAEAAERSDWRAASDAARVAAGVETGRGALASAVYGGSVPVRAAYAAAAAGLLAGDRAEALAVFLRLERAAFPRARVAAMADAASASFGNLERASYVLVPSGWLCVLGACCLAGAALALLRIPPKRGQIADSAGRVGTAGTAGRRRIAFVLVVAGAMALILAGASALERSRPRFVSLGGLSRAVPSGLSAEGRTVEAGRTGTVLQSAGAWSFVELDDGGAVWLATGDIARY